MDISLKQMEHAVALARLRHFGRAADFLGISQPALSRSVQSLEARLDSRLFERSRAGVRLTASGEAFLDYARSALEQAALMRDRLRDREQARDNQLSVVVGLYPAEISVPDALGRLTRIRPGVQVNAEIAEWNRAYDLLNSGETQLVLAERVADEGLASEPVSRLPVYFVVRPEHPLAEDRPWTFDDVLSHPWACSRVPMRAAEAFPSTPMAAGSVDRAAGHFVPAVTAPSLSTSLRLALESNLVAVSPLAAAESYLASGRLRLVRYAAPWMRLNYGFSWRRETTLTEAARIFMDCVREAEGDARVRARELARRYGCEGWHGGA
ncbi:MAG: LysR family transcriptional regulator [Gammaproteobacteria bacterium]